MSRIFRCLVCLLLVVCILVISPLQAYATGLEAAAIPVVVEAAKVLLPVIAALGVYAGIDTGYFEQVGRDCATAMTELGHVVNDTVTVWISDGLSYVSENLIHGVWNWLFDSGTVEVTEDYVYSDFSGLNASFHDFYLECLTYPNHFLAYNSLYDRWMCGYSYIPFQAVYNESFSNAYSRDIYNISLTDGTQFAFAYNNADGSYKQTTLPLTDATWYTFSTGVSTSISSPADLTLGRIATPSETDEDLITKVWVEPLIIEIPSTDTGGSGDGDDSGDDENSKTRLYPLSVNSTPRPNITQDEAQTGETDIEPEVDTGGDSGSTDGSGNTGTNTGTNSPSGSWTPPSDYNQFALADLKNFFPFCIPFDLFDFFRLLNADPVAPVLSWEIQDLSGQSYSLEIDLSEWDSVALLFRRLQLFLFITGLAVASRKYIKW